MKNFGKLAVLGAALAVSATYAHATLIPAGSTVAVSSLAPSAINGTVVATLDGSVTVDFPTTPGPFDYTASMVETVIKGGSTDSLCSTCLTFEFAVTDVSGVALESATVASFLVGQEDDVEYITGGSGPAITSATSNASGSAITFSFPEPLLTAGETDTFIVETNATQYGVGNLGVTDDATGNIADYAPSTPEPSSLILLGTGLLGSAGMLMRRRRQAV